MAEPQTKAALLQRIADEHQRLGQTLQRIPTSELSQPSLEDGWSVKDVLAHLTWWEQRMLQLMRIALQGQTPQSFAAPDEDHGVALNRINQQIFEENQQRPVEAIFAEREQSFGQVIAAVEALPEDIIADSSAVDEVLGGSLLLLIAGNTYNHYREHNDAIEAWLRETAPAAMPGEAAEPPP